VNIVNINKKIQIKYKYIISKNIKNILINNICIN